MSKLFRVLITLIIAFVLLGIIAIVGLVIFVNPNDLKPQISQAITKYTGRELQLSGDIEWSLYPWLGLQLNHAKLSNAPGFGDTPFANIDKLDIQIRLLPLLHKQLEIGKLYINGLTLHLTKNKQGQVNWSFNPSNTQTTPSANSSEINANSIPNAIKPLGFVITGLNIHNGQIIYEDLQQNTHYTINHLELKSASVKPDESSPLSARFNVSSNQPQFNAAIKLASTLTLSVNGQQLLLHPLKINAQIKDDAYPNGTLPISWQGNANINLSDGSFISNQFNTSIAGNKLTGQLNGQHLFQQPEISGMLNGAQIKANKFVVQQLQLPFQYKSNILTLNPIAATFYQGQYKGDVTVNFTHSTPQIVTNSHLTQLNTQALLQTMLGNNTQISLAGLANINFNGSTQGSDQTTLLKNLQGSGNFNLDQGAIKGVNLSYWIALGKALLRHEPSPAPVDSHDTPFNKFAGSFTIAQGILSNNDLAVNSGRLNINGKGTINLLQQQINYELQAQSVLADGSPDGVAIPINISGSFDHIRIAPVLDKLTLGIVKEKLKNRLQQQLKKLDLKKLFH